MKEERRNAGVPREPSFAVQQRAEGMRPRPLAGTLECSAIGGWPRGQSARASRNAAERWGPGSASGVWVSFERSVPGDAKLAARFSSGLPVFHRPVSGRVRSLASLPVAAEHFHQANSPFRRSLVARNYEGRVFSRNIAPKAREAVLCGSWTAGNETPRRLRCCRSNVRGETQTFSSFAEDIFPAFRICRSL